MLIILLHNSEEKMTRNLSRFVVIVWIFVVLVLTSSYTASLASMLTVQKLQPTLTNISELKKRGDYVGCQDGSFAADMLTKDMGFNGDKFQKYANVQEYANALSNGTTKNGVSAIVDEVPYLKTLQEKSCNKYVMVGTTYKTAGFGFAFPKGSPLVAEFSSAILKVVEGKIRSISDRWIKVEADCPGKNENVEPFDKLTLEIFKGLFFVAGLSSTCALVIFLFMFLYENQEILVSDDSIHHNLTEIIQKFDKKKDLTPSTIETIGNSNEYIEENMINGPPMSPTISVYHQDEEAFSSASPSVQPINEPMYLS